MRKKIGTKMILVIVPILVIAMGTLTIISAISSNNIINDEVVEKMDANLKYNEEAISAQLDQVRAMANAIAVTTANTYTTNDLPTYEKMLNEIIQTNDMVLGSGLWFEPYVFDANEEYVGPYIYKDGGEIVVTYDYSNAEYDYFSQEYYINAMNSTGATITDPYYDATSGMIMSTCSAPIMADGKAIGCVTVDIELSSITALVDSVKVGKNGVGCLTTSDGVYLAGVPAEMLETVTNIKDDTNPEVAAFGNTLCSTESGVSTYHDGGEFNLYYDTIGGVNWKFFIKMPTSELKAPVTKLTIELLAVCVVAIVLSVVIILKQLATVVKGIIKVQKFAGELADGNLTVDTLQVKGEDELARMSVSLNEMYDSNRDVISNISQHSGEINVSSARLSESATNLKSEFDNIESLMTGVNSDMMNSSAATEELTASVEQVNSSTEVLAEETVGSLRMAQEIQQRAQEIERSARTSAEQANQLRDEYQTKLSQSIEQAKVVENIGEMARIISDIAEQITLLSLNASIEAARAGEQGKGFAVVASEIGKLAGETATAVSSIQQTIQDVQTAFEGLAGNANVLLGFVTDTVTPDYQNFVGVAEQYGKDADDIRTLSERISEMSTNIQGIMEEVTDAIQNIAQSTQNTADASASIMTSMEDVSDIVTDVSEMSEQQHGISENLTSVVNKFRIEI